MRVRSLLLTAFAALSLTACDSSEPDGGTPPDALAGTWTLDRTETDVYVTSSTDQTYVDRQGATTGQISVTGAATAALRYVDYLDVGSTSRQARLTSYDPQGSGGTQMETYQLELYGSTTSGTLRLSVYTPSGYETYEGYVAAAPFTLTGAQLRVPAATLTSYDGTRQVQVAGELSFPAVSIPAGQRTRIQHRERPFVSWGAVRYVLEDGGVFRAERDVPPNVTESVAGTWTADGDRLRLSVTRDEVTETQTFSYALSGSTLRLAYTEPACRTGDELCFGSLAASLGLTPGSLTSHEAVHTSVFTAGPSAAQARGASPAVGPETPIWPRLLAGPTARESQRPS